MKLIQIANKYNGIRNFTVPSNYIQFRADSCCLKRTSWGLNRYNDMRYKCSFPYETPGRVSFKTFSNASTSMVEEMTEEEELNSLLSHETQARAVPVAPYNHEFSTTAAKRALSGGDNRGWTREKNKLAEGKKEMNDPSKFERKIGSSYASNRFTSVGQKQAVSKNAVSNLVLQDHSEHVSSSVKSSVLNHSKVITDSETVVRQFNESSLEISEEKITRVNGDCSFDVTTEESSNATIPREAHGTDKSRLRDRLCSIYEDILVVDNIPLAEEVAKMLTGKYRHLIYACDTEV